jgi:hypothetical protein
VVESLRNFRGGPTAVLLVILSLFGFSKFEDVRKAAHHADGLLGQAQTKLSQSGSQLDSAEKKVTELVDCNNWHFLCMWCMVGLSLVAFSFRTCDFTAVIYKHTRRSFVAALNT